MLNIVIVDDQIDSLKQLEQFIINTQGLELICSYRSSDRFLKGLKENNFIFDLLFLNTELPDSNGLQLARIMSEMKAEVDIVFISDKKEYAIEAFELNALDYLLKPLNQKSLERVISRFFEK